MQPCRVAVRAVPPADCSASQPMPYSQPILHAAFATDYGSAVDAVRAMKDIASRTQAAATFLFDVHRFARQPATHYTPARPASHAGHFAAISSATPRHARAATYASHVSQPLATTRRGAARAGAEPRHATSRCRRHSRRRQRHSQPRREEEHIAWQLRRMTPA